LHLGRIRPKLELQLAYRAGRVLRATRQELVALLAGDLLDYFVHKMRVVLSLLASDFGQLLSGRAGLDVRPGWRVVDA